MKSRLLSYAKRKYGTAPDRPFVTAPAFQVLRHERSGKWYALFMDVPRSRLGVPGEGSVDVVNLKCDSLLSGVLRDGVGILPGYHMNRQSWITVLLDGTVAYKDITPLIDLSYQLTSGGGKHITDWLIPANPAYFDIAQALRESEDSTIFWKQSSSVHVGDAVYIYMAAPVSGIVYRCEALEVDIPREYADENVRMRRMMRLRVLQIYDPPIPRDVLIHHGVNAVRGPRGMPEDLIQEIREITKSV